MISMYGPLNCGGNGGNGFELRMEEMAARSSGDRFLLSNGTMHQATKLSRWNSRLAASLTFLSGAVESRAPTAGAAGDCA